MESMGWQSELVMEKRNRDEASWMRKGGSTWAWVKRDGSWSAQTQEELRLGFAYISETSFMC